MGIFAGVAGGGPDGKDHPQQLGFPQKIARPTSHRDAFALGVGKLRKHTLTLPSSHTLECVLFYI